MYSLLCLWGCLLAVWIDRPEVINSIPRIKTWMERLNALESFKSGLGEIFKGKQKNIQWNFSTWYKKASDCSVSNATKKNTEENAQEKTKKFYDLEKKITTGFA